MEFLRFFPFSFHRGVRHSPTPAALFVFAVFFGGAARAEQLCPVPPAPSPEAHNIFSAEQERDLGEVEAERLEKNQQVIQDDRLAGHLNTISSRLLSQFPGIQIKIRIILIDMPEADAFSAGISRIYITRTMVAMLRNDDELAGVLGHEMEHIFKHENAIIVTQMFHDILGVDSVGDRKDIADKFSRMVNGSSGDQNVFWNTAHKMLRRKEIDQYEADRFALCATAAAGFSPQAYAQFFDRFAQTHGKTGNRLTDLFGVTGPEEKRLREIYKSLRQLPRACREIVPAASSGEFVTWQKDVMAYATVALSRKEETTE